MRQQREGEPAEEPREDSLRHAPMDLVADALRPPPRDSGPGDQAHEGEDEDQDERRKEPPTPVGARVRRRRSHA
jgi:hypothetical protein